jgi:HD-GYP domain-containing protein (c-di-GMP phosphodiesterase class II)
MDITESTLQPQRVSRKSPEATESDLLKLGSNLVTKFHVLMRISRTYDVKNVTFRQFTQEFVQTINTLIEKEGSLSIRVIRDDLFFNEQRLRYSVEGFTSFKYLQTQWKKRLIGGVTFQGLVDERMLKEFISTLFNLEEGREENADYFNEQLTNHGIHSIEVFPLEDIEGGEGTTLLHQEDQQAVAKKVFFETIKTIKEVSIQIKGNQYADLRRLKRLAQKMIQLVIEDESILLGLTTIKNYDEYTFNHSVNVSIYSLAMGRRLGFSRKELTELGLTALLHDIGKSKIPKETLNKPDKLDDEEWNLMKRHPLMGVETILNLKQLGEINPRMLIGVFEHHLKNNLSGYPKLFRKKEASLFGRIIQIADSYDAMTTPRIYKKVPYIPEQALAIMLKDREVHFDPVLLKIFIGFIGIYPIGSLVLLDNHELGIVFKTNPDSQWMDRPTVLLVARDEKGDAKKKVIDLTETDEEGHFKWSVVKTLDPRQYHIDIMKYFLFNGS